MSDREQPEEETLGAPLYMLSFGDMMTNLLCFFILLCAFASEQKVGFITDGVRSIQEALISSGLPGVLPADRKPLDIGADQVLFRPAPSIAPTQLLEDDGTFSDRNRDALREVITEALRKEGPVTLPTPFIFKRGSARLSTRHQRVLREIASTLAGGDYLIKVSGFTFREGLNSPQAEWDLALERSQNVINYMMEVGDIPRERFVQYGRGPVLGNSIKNASVDQQTWGGSIVLLEVVED